MPVPERRRRSAMKPTAHNTATITIVPIASRTSDAEARPSETQPDEPLPKSWRKKAVLLRQDRHGKDRRHARDAEQAPVRRHADPFEIDDRAQVHEQQGAGIGADGKQEAGQQQETEAVERDVEPGDVHERGCIVVADDRPQGQQEGMARIVADRLLGDRFQLAVVFAQGEPCPGLARAVRAFQPVVRVGPIRCADLTVVALGIIERRHHRAQSEGQQDDDEQQPLHPSQDRNGPRERRATLRRRGPMAALHALPPSPQSWTDAYTLPSSQILCGGGRLKVNTEVKGSRRARRRTRERPRVPG